MEQEQDFSPARRHARHAVELSVVCGSNTGRLADRVVNVSSGGACIQTPTPLPRGSLHPFVFTVPDARFRDATVMVNGRVTWSQEHAMGIRFEGASAGIEDYVKRLERSMQSF
jgi:hypothetical protein